MRNGQRKRGRTLRWVRDCGICITNHASLGSRTRLVRTSTLVRMLSFHSGVKEVWPALPALTVLSPAGCDREWRRGFGG